MDSVEDAGSAVAVAEADAETVGVSSGIGGVEALGLMVDPREKPSTIR